MKLITPTLQTQLDEQRRRVDVDNYDVTVRELVRMAAEGELERAPTYQRKFRWSEEDESKLIESLLLGLPVPSPTLPGDGFDSPGLQSVKPRARTPLRCGSAMSMYLGIEGTSASKALDKAPEAQASGFALSLAGAFVSLVRTCNVQRDRKSR